MNVKTGCNVNEILYPEINDPVTLDPLRKVKWANLSLPQFQRGLPLCVYRTRDLSALHYDTFRVEGHSPYGKMQRRNSDMLISEA